jgi:hypothetical protein
MLQIVDLLCAHGADPNTENENGSFPLQEPSESGHEHVVRPRNAKTHGGSPSKMCHFVFVKNDFKTADSVKPQSQREIGLPGDPLSYILDLTKIHEKHVHKFIFPIGG